MREARRKDFPVIRGGERRDHELHSVLGGHHTTILVTSDNRYSVRGDINMPEQQWQSALSDRTKSDHENSA